MCLAVPARVLALHDGGQATVALPGGPAAVSLVLVEGVAIGDHVLVQGGYATARLDPEEAARTLALLAEAA